MCTNTTKNSITHLTMIKGTEAHWKCVGNEVIFGKIGNHRCFSNGNLVPISVY